MSLPGNGIFVVRGELTILMTAMKRGARWSSHSYQDDDLDTLMKNLQELKEMLNRVDDLRFLDPDTYLTPFLNVISEETTGPVTSLALSAVNKFLSYGIIDPTHKSIPQTVHNIADAVTHARFVGTDQSSDGVVLLRILQVLRTLTLAPEGATLTNESLCEIMLSCFRICFETKLNELLRRTAEHYLKDMVQLIFMRLPQFSEDLRSVIIKQIKMGPGAIDHNRNKRKSKSNIKKKEKDDIEESDVQERKFSQTVQANEVLAMPNSPNNNIVDMQGSISQSLLSPEITSSDLRSSPSVSESEPQSNMDRNQSNSANNLNEINSIINDSEKFQDPSDNLSEEISTEVKTNLQSNDLPPDNSDGTCISYQNKDYINDRGIRFTPQLHEDIPIYPYGLGCVRELFRFLISLCNPLDKQNTDVMIHLGLSLLIVAFEVSADHIGKYSTLLTLVKNELCRNLLSLLSSERLAIFASDLQLSFLLFESLRPHLKYQMECYLKKLMEIIVNDSVKASYEHKEIALDCLLQLWKIPGYVSELYLNYDCDIYCTNLYEELTKLLSKNVMSATSGVYHTHLLSLDALLTVINNIEKQCNYRDKSETVNLQDDTIIENGTLENFDNLTENSCRIKLSETVPSKDYLAARRNIKKWLPQGTEYFNQKPKKGIQFLQEHGVLKSELDPVEVAIFLRENPGLNKAMIGEYISSRNNLALLDAFVKTFEFTDVRIDEALRTFLETFRLPGEAPTISLILENFAEHWHKSNGEPFADVDSAFTLAYAIIMLNVDQHNENAKKQTVPMSCSAFKKNLKGVNGGNDFEEEMLDEIYTTIKNDEIVMPSEHSGLVKENYLWKVLLRKGASKDGIYYHINDNTYDNELYQLIYGSVVAALSFVYEKTEDQNVSKKVMEGFEKCAIIASNFNMRNNLDMLILTLCKFTSFHNAQKQTNIVVNFGFNKKAQMALKTVFTLIHNHGDNIREGWKNIFDLILTLYSNGLLPKSYVEAEDFIENSGKVTLVYEENPAMPKQDTGLLSSLYSYMVSAENLSKVPSPEEQQATEAADMCIKECMLDQLISDSKFLHEDALAELVNTLIELSRGPDVQKSIGYTYNENVTIFFLELLIKIVIQNRDRVKIIWLKVRDHIYTIVMNASVFDYQFLLERSVIGLLRIAIRLMRNEEMSPIVLQSLRMLLLLKSSTLNRISRQISFGLYELLKTSAQNIHTNTDWTIIFTLLECVGAGAQPPKPISGENSQVDQGTRSDPENPTNSDEDDVTADRGYTSDSELAKSPKHIQQRSNSPVVPSSPAGSPNAGGWILVGNEGEIQPVVGRTVPPLQYGLSLERNLGPHDPSSLIKCCESLAFLVRDVAHITPYNFDECVHCIRTFVEASLNGNMMKKNVKQIKTSKKSSSRRRAEAVRNRKSPTSSQDEEDDSEDDNLPSSYHQISIQLLDLMHTLHTRTAQIFKWWAEEGGEIAQETSLWAQGWCPLLQGIARLCCDNRRHVRMTAITYLQRALLVHDLQTLTGPEWEQCFQRVLFPLLNYLLQPVAPKYSVTMEETRMRAATVLSKVFLHHLTPLLSLSTFSSLWLVILDFMNKYMHADQSDLLYEAVPESLKNMLLVMDSAKVFDGPDGKNALWEATWEKISKFLPNMKEELFQEVKQNVPKPEVSTPPVNIQHNIQNATKSSIILQPPSMQQNISSHLFAHLGQMVSTPIGVTQTQDVTERQSTIPTSLPQMPVQQETTNSFLTNQATMMQPTLQPGLPYMSNLFPSQTSHSFPILYNGPFPPSTSTTSEVQPVSLYSEYLGNPYNTVTRTEQSDIKERADNANVSPDDSQFVSTNTDMNRNSNSNNNVNSGMENNNSTIFFQSSNYFSNVSNTNFIPVGSEVLFGVNVQTPNTNIVIDDNQRTTTTTDI